MSNVVETRVCSTCGEEKLMNEYWKKCKHRGGYATQCKTCWYAVRQADRKKRPGVYLNQSLRDRFGITLDEYKAKLIQQRGVCAICGQPETVVLRGKIKALSVDHNHLTDQVRGLLCDACNKAIGCFHEDVHVLDSAIRYLMFYRDVSVTNKSNFSLKGA